MSVILTVKQLNTYVRNILESDKYLQRITVSGEISGFKLYNSGHAYFTLKDSESAVSSVMFAKEFSLLKFRPEDGMKVFVTGRVSVFEKTGQYQLYVSDMIPDGIGSEFIAYEQLKRKLEKEGLFDPENKKSVPRYPKKIGLISSLNGAAIHDFCVTVQNRYPFADILICEATVQGEDCPRSVIRAIEMIKNKNIDVLVITRGGGSFEDLSGFNDETLARTVYALDVPVVSAIGHETDFTILDFVADFRAATPTAAAQSVTPSKEELYLKTDSCFSLCKRAIDNFLDCSFSFIDNLSERIDFDEVLNENSAYIATLSERSAYSVSSCFADCGYLLDKIVAEINALSPLSVLSRGYSLAYSGERLVSSVDSVRKGDNIEIILKDGEIFCDVTDKTNIHAGVKTP